MWFIKQNIMKASLFIYLFVLLFTNDGWAQTHNIKFNLVTGKNEVSIGKINGITQDLRGVYVVCRPNPKMHNQVRWLQYGEFQE